MPQEEEDRKLAAEEDRIQLRMDELEAQEAAAGPFAGFGSSLGGFGWPFGRRRPLPAPAVAAGAAGPSAGRRGQRSGGRRSRWQNSGAPHFAVGSLADILGGGPAHRGFAGHGPPSNLLALQQVVGAQRSNLPPQLLFRWAVGTWASYHIASSLQPGKQRPVVLLATVSCSC
jgi:hypothetical protein